MSSVPLTVGEDWKEAVEVFREWGEVAATPRPILGIHLIVADACNMDCSYCFYAKSSKKISRENAFRAIRWLLDPKVSQDKSPHVTFFGGEPTVDEDLVKDIVLFGEELALRMGRVNKVRGRDGTFHDRPGISFGVVSNFYKISTEFMEFCRDHGISFLASCDGPRLQGIARKEGSYERVAGNIQEALSRGCSVMIAQQISPGYTDLAFDDLMSLFELGVKAVFQNPVFHGITPYSEWDFANIRDMYEKISSLTIQKRRAGIGPNEWQVASLEKKISSIGRTEASPQWLTRVKQGQVDKTCGACKGSLAVNADGAIVPCQQMTVEYPHWTLGHVASPHKFRTDLWDKFREEQFDQCKDCIVTSCAPCRTINKYRTNSEHLIPEDYCRYSRLVWLFAVQVYNTLLDTPWYAPKKASSPPPPRLRGDENHVVNETV